MATLRTTVTLLIALAMLAGFPTVAATHVGDEAQHTISEATHAGSEATEMDDRCEDFHASSVPLVHPAVDVAVVELCDVDGDGTWDTAEFDSRVGASGEVSVTDRTRQRSDHQDRRTEAEAEVTTDGPVRPVVYQSASLHDEGNDGQVDRIDQEGEAATRMAGAYYLVTGLDQDGDQVVDGYGLTLCAPGAGCERPGIRTLPEIPNRIDLPDTVVELPVVGYVP